MKSLSIVKRLAVAGVAAAALAGSVTAAHALQFNQGDVVLAVYGNNTEYAANIGTLSNLLTNGVNHDLSGVISQLQVGGNPLLYTLVAYQGATGMFFGDRDPIGSWTTLQKNQVQPLTFTSSLAGWGTELSTAGDVRNLFPKDDALSFTTKMNAAGANNFGAIPAAHPGAASLESILNLLQRPDGGAAGSLTQVGTAILSLQGPQAGHFVVSAVPVPAAAVLFATGIVGLIGVARRRVFGRQ